ncbi:MAG TPA: hypothetical protein VGB73_08350 [Pyrinomonadaceae bacterium]|jgi:hypothetical protein
MPFNLRRSGLVLLFACLFVVLGVASVSAQQPAEGAQPATEDWGDSFDGDALDEKKWERFTFEGGGGKVEVRDGQARLRGVSGSRAGIITRTTFTSDRFVVEARLARVGESLPEPGKQGTLGFAIVAIMFDGSGRNRVEWMLTSEGMFEAWSVVDGRGERLDNRKLGTKMKNPVLAVVRRGDEFLFIVNAPESPAQEAQVGLRKTIKNMPRSFRVMLYGFGSSENNWDALRVTAMK